MTTVKGDPTLADLVSFTWWRARNPDTVMWRNPDGSKEAESEWEDLDAEYRLCLVLDDGDGELIHWPLRNRALFRIFAELEDSEDEFVDFVQQFGGLGDHRHTEPHPLASGVVEGRWRLCPLACGDTLERWRAERRALAYALRLFDALRHKGTAEVLRDDLRVEPMGGVRGVWLVGQGSQWLSANLDHESEPNLEVGLESSGNEIVERALAYVLTSALIHCGVTPAVVATGGGRGTGIRLTLGVETLLGAMWLQFALAADEAREYRTCAVCGTSWESTGARETRNYCSQKCRQRLQRKKAEEKREANARGASE